MDYRNFCRLGPMICVMLTTNRECDECLYCDKDAYIAALRAQLAELAQCRDHWKASYEDVRAKLKQAEGE